MMILKGIIFFIALLLSIMTAIDFVISILVALKRNMGDQNDGMKRWIYVILTCIAWTALYML